MLHMGSLDLCHVLWSCDMHYPGSRMRIPHCDSSPLSESVIRALSEGVITGDPCCNNNIPTLISLHHEPLLAYANSVSRFTLKRMFFQLEWVISTRFDKWPIKFLIGNRLFERAHSFTHPAGRFNNVISYSASSVVETNRPEDLAHAH
jgi:hypothetical protein